MTTPTTITRLSLPLLLTLTLLTTLSCTTPVPPQPLTEPDTSRIKAELQDRSFRQFKPAKDASPRKAVILDFFGSLTIWAQYAESDHALNEWEIASSDHLIRQDASDSNVITLHPIQPASTQTLPTRCENCIPTEGVSISIRDVFDSDNISFKLNDPNGLLPSPFPVFESWTRFSEDEYVN